MNILKTICGNANKKTLRQDLSPISIRGYSGSSNINGEFMPIPKQKNGCLIWKKIDEQDMFLYCSAQGLGMITTEEEMESDTGRCICYCKSKAVHPNKTTEAWDAILNGKWKAQSLKISFMVR